MFNKISKTMLGATWICLLIVIFGAKSHAETGNSGSVVTDSGVAEVTSITNDFRIGMVQPESDLFTGGMRLSIPIEVPFGRNGMSPDLKLVYRSSKGNGWVGMGWELEITAIERNSRLGVGFDKDDYVLIKGGGTQEIVNIGNNVYRAKIEGNFTRAIKKISDSDGRGG